MATVGDMAKLFSVSPSTIKMWCGEFGEYLSPLATPEPGQARAFNDDDIQIMGYIAAQRDNGRPYDDIAAGLANGEASRFIPPEHDRNDQQPTQLQVMRLTATIARFEGELTATNEALTLAREELTEERAARLEAEKKAAITDILQSQNDKMQSELDQLRAALDVEKSKTWWQKLRRQ